MTGTTPRVIVIPPKPELARSKAVQRQLRVAAYCRVSTDDEEQLTSYEAQQTYYTDKIMTNPQWTMAGIFADEGITGTSAQKRPEFQRMIRKCRQKKIDLVLVKSISRFARNTVDCLNYIRALRTLGIAVIFEKENINTLETDSEMLITMMGAFAQAESESMSANIVWGKRQAMREGKTNVQFQHLYGYELDEDGKPRIVPEQAAVVKHIYDSFLAGRSIRMIKKELAAEMETMQEQTGRVDKFMALVDRYTSFDELTTPMLNEFVEKVVVHERVSVGRYKRKQRVDVYFNFIGLVELPTEPEDEAPAAAEPPQERYVAVNTSFAPLGEYLSQQTENSVTLSFADVERVIGKPLCKSAFKFYSYWYPGGNRPISNVIYNAGFDVDRVDLKNQLLYLIRAA